MAPDGTAYIAFRSPLVNGSGPTTSLEQRTNALIVPLLNMPALVAGNPTPGPGTAQFGTPFTLNLKSRGVRSIDCTTPGHYLITAGPPGEVSYPPTAPNNFRLFTWMGNPDAAPREQVTEFPYEFTPEGAILPAGPISSSTVAQFVSDDPGCWKSFTACVAPEVRPPLEIAASGNDMIVSWPASASGFSLQYCTDLSRTNWVNSTAPVSISGARMVVTERADNVRFYRLIKL